MTGKPSSANLKAHGCAHDGTIGALVGSPVVFVFFEVACIMKVIGLRLRNRNRSRFRVRLRNLKFTFLWGFT